MRKEKFKRQTFKTLNKYCREKGHKPYSIGKYINNHWYDYINEYIHVYVFTIQIIEPCWDFEADQIIEVPIIAKSEYQAHNIMEDYEGSEYPFYKIIGIKILGRTFLFNLSIQWNILKDIKDAGAELIEEKLKKINENQHLWNKIKYDKEQPERAITNYLIETGTNIKIDRKEFYKMVSDCALNELNLIKDEELEILNGKHNI